MPDVGYVSLEAFFSDFRKLCVEIHGVNKSNGVDCLTIAAEEVPSIEAHFFPLWCNLFRRFQLCV